MEKPLDLNEALEEKCYQLQAQMNLIRASAITFLGKKKVTKLEKNINSLLEGEINKLKQEPLDL